MTLVSDPGPLANGVDRTATALALPEGLDFDEWAGIGRSLFAAAEAVAWWVGDWLLYGEGCYGAQYRTAAEWTRLDPGTLADYQWVAGHVAPERRRTELSWRHHREVAALEPEAQIAWLNTAAEGGWSSRELATQVRADRSAETPDDEPATPARPSPATKVEVDAPRIVVRGEVAHVEMLRAVTNAAGDQLRETAEGLASRIREHLADAGVSAVVEVR